MDHKRRIKNKHQWEHTGKYCIILFSGQNTEDRQLLKRTNLSFIDTSGAF